MAIEIILGSILICITFFLLTVLIVRSIKNYIRRKNIIDTQNIIKEDLKNNNNVHKHNIILNNNVSSAINSARSVMKGKK